MAGVQLIARNPKAALLALAAAAVVAAGCVAEAAYLVFGRSGVAQVTDVRLVTRCGRGGCVRLKVVDYAFTEPDRTQRTGRVERPYDWHPPASGRLPVRYTPGKSGRCRPAEDGDWLAVALGGVLLAVGAAGGVLWRASPGGRGEVVELTPAPDAVTPPARPA